MHQTKRSATIAATVVSIGWSSIAAAATLNVPGDYPTIQACINAAVGGVDECVVAPGTYHETINFIGKAITLRSSGGADVTTIDATNIGGSVVTCARGEGPDTALDGFTITGGTGMDNGFGSIYGGGMYNDNHSSPTVTNCTFRGNMGTDGGGMFNYYSSPTVTNCVFNGNIVTGGGGGMGNYDGNPVVIHCTFCGNTAKLGGGMYNYRGNPTVTNCSFGGNMALATTYVYHGGGGMYNKNTDPTVVNCTFSGNSATRGGGGMNNDTSRPKVTYCTFWGNKAADGGGMYNYNASAPTVTNCTFIGNNAGDGGGGMFNFAASPLVSNCTLSGNTAGDAGSGMYNYYVFPRLAVTQCILWRDSPDEIANGRPNDEPTIRFSVVQGGLPVGAIDGGGNFDLDPMFVRLPDPGLDGSWDGVDDDYGDLRLQSGSPCINAGDPAFVAQPGETDLDGHARVLCGWVDMGAYEFGIGDYDCDQTIDLTDFAAWNACMTGPLDSGAFYSTIDIRQSTFGCEAFDFDGNGEVDLLDFAALQLVFNGP